MEYRQTSENLLTNLEIWDKLIEGNGKIHLIACGGTALTLMGYKPSTKDVDFLIPVEKEYKKLITFLKKAGYRQETGHSWRRENETAVYDLFMGKTVFMTELLHSPLSQDRHKKFREFEKIYLGILNPIDLIITKLARGDEVDYQDCLTLLAHEKIDIEKLKKEYEEAAKYSINFGINENKAAANLSRLLSMYKKSK